MDPDFGTVRVPRIVGAYDVGRVINPKVARSQCIGGMVGGVGMALLEQAEWDARLGRVMNANLAEYLVPVNADVTDLDVTSSLHQTRSSIHWVQKAWRRSRCAASRLQSPTPYTMPPASACAICRSLPEKLLIN